MKTKLNLINDPVSINNSHLQKVVFVRQPVRETMLITESVTYVIDTMLGIHLQFLRACGAGVEG